MSRGVEPTTDRERSGPVVVKLGGSVLTDGVGPELARALARIHRAGTPVILVHGGGSHVTDVMKRLGLAVEFVDGLRVTSPEGMDVVEMVLGGRVNKSVVSALQRQGVPGAVGVSGKDGMILSAVPHESSALLGQVGTVAGSDPRLLQHLLDGGFLPVVCSVAAGADGATFNVNADEAAFALAAAVEAERLVFVTDVAGVHRSPGSEEVVPRLTVSEAAELLDEGSAAGGMRPKLRACLQALDAGVGSVHVVGIGEVAQLPDLVAGRVALGTVVLPDGPGSAPPARGAADSTVGGGGRGAGRAGGGDATVEQWARRGQSVLLSTYRRLGLAFRRGEGVRLEGLDGKSYLDFIGGIAVSTLGHAHPDLVEAISSQAARYLHVSNLFEIPEQVEAAELLAGAGGPERVFFCNSGTEAVEGVIKVARKWGKARRGPGCHRIVVMEGAFHGRTLGALSATANPRYREPFAPLVPGFDRVPYDDLDAVEGALGPETCAVMVESVQGEGGVVVPDPGYMPGLRELTRSHDVLLALDEVQTGLGRTGRMFGYQHDGVEADLVAVAKGLGGGVPVGAVLVEESVAECIEPGDHASTFGGNPLASAAATAVLRFLLEDGGLEHAASMGAYLRQRLEELVAAGGRAQGVRGRGLLLALEVQGDAGELAKELATAGLLVNGLGKSALRIAPPLVVTRGEIDEAVEILNSI